MNKEIIIDGKGCRYKTWDEDCALTGDNHGDNMEPCKFIDEKNCYHMQLKAKEQECEELKQYQEDAEKVLKNILDNFDKMENRYRKALEEIEKHLKNYLNMPNPAVNEHNDGFNTGLKTAAAGD